RWLSGRKHRFAKAAMGQKPIRGFESPPLRSGKPQGPAIPDRQALRCSLQPHFFPASPKIILLTDTVSEESMVDRTGVEHKMAMTRDADHLDFQLSAFDLGRDLNGGHA
ncbi:MAG: hypothetical protein NTZ94_02770, partial [Verrucomicrobia bacterium]|nr:hypothetical protein [Verrucomicrobiota bacterium]